MKTFFDKNSEEVVRFHDQKRGGGDKIQAEPLLKQKLAPVVLVERLPHLLEDHQIANCCE